MREDAARTRKVQARRRARREEKAKRRQLADAAIHEAAVRANASLSQMRQDVRTGRLRPPTVCATRPVFAKKSREVLHDRPKIQRSRRGTLTTTRCWVFDLLLAGGRYFTMLECGSLSSPVACLVFKQKIHGAHVSGLHSFDGLNFVNAAGPNSRPPKCWLAQPLQLVVPDNTLWSDALLAHNTDILRLDPPSLGDPFRDRFMLIGGMQAYRRDAAGAIQSEDPKFGVRATVGYGWPPDWMADQPGRPRRWQQAPRVVLHGGAPKGCIDRRPHFTGNLGCEFDGRLSVVHFRGTYRLYARANLREGVLAGGRFVQTISSADPMASASSWEKWEPIRVMGLRADEVDVYFFAVQVNPAANSSLMAVFPLTQPPHACIAIAFSLDGVRFSRPVNLQESALGWRTAASNGTGAIEWRGESHPVAGVLRRGEEAWFYMHDSVAGVSMRLDRPRPSIRRYRMPLTELESLTRDAMRTLSSDKV